MPRRQVSESTQTDTMIEVSLPTAKAMSTIEIPIARPPGEEKVPAYTARVRQDPKNSNYWLADLVDEPRVHTFGRSMPEAVQHLEEATKLWYRMDAQDPIKLKVRLGEDIDADLDKTELLRDLMAAVTSQWNEHVQRLVSTLVGDRKLSLREVGTILELSPQRIHQLVRAVAKAAEVAETHRRSSAASGSKTPSAPAVREYSSVTVGASPVARTARRSKTTTKPKSASKRGPKA